MKPDDVRFLALVESVPKLCHHAVASVGQHHPVRQIFSPDRKVQMVKRLLRAGYLEIAG